MRKYLSLSLPLLIMLMLMLSACGDTATSAPASTTSAASTTASASTSAAATTTSTSGTAAANSTTTSASGTASASGTTAATVDTSKISVPSQITIAYQPGLGYAQLVIMKQQKTLEKAFPKTTFTWKLLGNGATIRDGMIAGQIQVGALGIPPFLVGWDKGVDWKMLSSLDDLDLWLMTNNPSIQSLKDIKPDMKIGMPAPDSIQAIVLYKASQDQLGNDKAKALANNILTIDHPTGVQALSSKQIAAHLTTPPYEFQEQAAGAKAILHSFDVFGQASSLGVFMTGKFYNQYPDFGNYLYQQIVTNTQFIKNSPDQAAQLLSQEDAGKTTPAQYQTWLADKAIVYDTTPHGLVKYAEFMKSIGFMSKTPSSVKDFELPTLNGAGD